MSLSFEKLLNNLGNFFGRAPESLRRKRLLIWIFCIAGAVACSIGLSGLKINVSFDTWYPKDDPVKAALNEFQAQFGGDDIVYLVYKPKDGDLFSKKTLEAITGIREELLNFRQNLEGGGKSMLGHITKVDSIASAKVLKAEGDSLTARQFIGKNFPLDEEAKKNLRDEALRQNDFPLLYFSRDFEYGAIVIETDLGAMPPKGADAADELVEEPAEDDGFGDSENEISLEADKSLITRTPEFRFAEADEYHAFMGEVNNIIHKKKYADQLEYYPVGMPVTMSCLLDQMKEMAPMSIASVLFLLLFLWIFFRSLSFVLWPVSIIIISCLWTMGLFGWAGVEVTEMFSLTITLVFAVGIASSVHIIAAYKHFKNKNNDHNESLKLAFQKAAPPCLLASLTTVIGLLAITLGPIKPIVVFGYMSALGVTLAFIFTICLLPLMMDVWSGPATDKKRGGALDASEWVRKGLGWRPVFLDFRHWIFLDDSLGER